ncbi:hypothetical protein HZA45_02570 [Candidatus Peregrinibacteria bacterium]|nr:hypothetical protein [Candidatus Peregrinibacteria bacterium]
MKFQNVIVGVFLSAMVSIMLTDAVSAGTYYYRPMKKKPAATHRVVRAPAGSSHSSSAPLPHAYLLPPAPYNPYAFSSVTGPGRSAAQSASSRSSSTPYFSYLSSSYGYGVTSASSRSAFQLSSRSAHSAFSLASRSSVRTQPYVFHSGCQNKHLLSQLFGNDQMTCGSPGWVFPGLIWGECPITACILKTKPGGLGGPTDF